MDQASNLRRMIKENHLRDQRKARVITITSGKGGVGKSNITVNLAVHLQKMGKKVIILDADFGLSNVEIIFGVLPKYNLFDAIYNGKTVQDILTSGPYGIEFISAGSGIDTIAELNAEQIEKLTSFLDDIDNFADIILIDTGAGISDAIMNLIAASNEVLLITTPEPTAITDAYALLKTLNSRIEDNKKQSLGVHLLVNRVENEREGLVIYKKLNTVTKRFLDWKLSNIGFLPQDKMLVKSVIKQTPVTILYPQASISKALKTIADNLTENKTYAPTKKTGISRLFSHLLKLKT